MRLREIGERFKVRDTAISEASRRFAGKLETDEELRRKVVRIRRKIGNM
jgi:chromosomal replication initiation ATPase DnaA